MFIGSWWRRLLSEFLGSAVLTTVVVGSGIAAQQLSPGQIGLELLENALITGLGLACLIEVFAPVSGAHFNPVVTVADVIIGEMTWRRGASYLPAQIFGCILGAVVANQMFGVTVWTWSHHSRLTTPHFVSEVLATAGLIVVIFSLARNGRHSRISLAVGGYISAAYFFTSSTSFANPAITVGRMFTNSFAGIAPSSVVGFVTAQLLGMLVGLGVVTLLFPRPLDNTSHPHFAQVDAHTVAQPKGSELP